MSSGQVTWVFSLGEPAICFFKLGFPVPLFPLHKYKGNSMTSGAMRRGFLSSWEFRPTRHIHICSKGRLQHQRFLTNSFSPPSSPTVSTDRSKVWAEKLLPAKRKESVSPLPASSSLSASYTSPSRVLSQFYRGLATQNLDQLWPLYTIIYQANLHTRLTRQNYRQLVLVTTRSAKTQRNLHRLLAVIEDMQQLAHPLRRSDFNMLMYWVGGATVPETRSRHLTEALGWLTTMESPVAGPIEPCVVTYNTLIHVASQANDLLTAQRLYHAMLAKGIQADAFTYTTLLQCMATMGDLQGVEDMLARLETKKLGGLVRNTVTWNMLLDCYYTYVAKYGDTTDEHVTMNDNDDDDDDNEDNDTAEGIRSCVTATNRSYEAKADSMFQAMVEALNQNSPTVPVADAITFQIYIDHLLRKDQRDDAIHTLLESVPQIQPTITIYNRLFASFKNHPIPSSSFKLQQLYTSFQQQHHLRPTTETLDALVNALLDQQEPTLALKTFVDLSQQENLSPCPELIERLSNVLQEQQEQQLSHTPSST